MTDSAIASRAAQRRQATASRLSAVCRRLTAQGGLAGFTIEEACDEVGVSRRTFFNYFPSKEEAVLGIDEGEEMQTLSARFLELGSRGWAVVLDDILELISEYWHAVGVDAAEHRELIRAIEREPKLLARFVGMGRERDLEIAALIATREGVTADDPHVRACVEVLSAIMRSTGERLLDPRVAENPGGALTESLDAIRVVLLDTSTPRKARP